MRSARTTILSVALALLLILVTTTAFAQALTITLNKTVFIPGETIEVRGTTSPNADVTVGIINPDGELVDLKIVTANGNGNFIATFRIPSTIPIGKWTKFGTYTVKAKSGVYEATATFELSTTAWITGTVVDEVGNPVAGATVAIVETGVTSTTDSTGKFTIYVDPGTWTLRVSKPGYKEAEVTITAVTGPNDVGTVKITSLESVLLALEDEVSKLKEQVANLTVSYEVVNEMLKTIVGKLDEISEKLDTVDMTVSGIKSKTDDISTAVSELGSKLDAVRSELSAISGKIDGVSSAVGTISSKIDTLSGKVDSISSKVDDLSGKVDALSSDLATMKSDVSEALSGLKSTVDTLKSTVEALRTDITGLRQDVAGLPDTIKGTVADISSKVDTVSAAAWIAVVFALLAFIFALMAYLTIRRAVAK